MPYVLDQEVPADRQSIAIYGDPKTGKTPLALSIPFGTDYWGEAVYFASDDGSESLRPCPPQNKQFIHTIKAGIDPKTGLCNPITEAWDIILGTVPGSENDWRKLWPKAKTFVWDTATETGEEIKDYIADTGQFSDEKHITIGGPGSRYKHNIAMQGDFMAAQEEMGRLIKALHKSDMHLVVLFHTKVKESKNGAMLLAGPGTVGNATIRSVAKPFHTVLRLEKKLFTEKDKPSEQRVVVNTEASGVYVGGIRMSGRNPLPVAAVPNDKPLSVFWDKYMELFYPEVKV